MLTSSRLAYSRLMAGWDTCRCDWVSTQYTANDISLHLPVSCDHCDQSQRIICRLYTMDGFMSCHSLYTIMLLAVTGQGSHMIQTGPITAHLYNVISFAQSQLITTKD
ncbi:unnamed protein product [Staurois parvus]|uniref:Uncharacterized protein n=1 Tax=Staurois parvus TaxID=386267 RepID=A0ABN9G5J4_9NEOB|nr:unnamed protein product [Staurois parvus]